MNQLLAMRAFCCIVENRGFSAAAEQWETTSSTLSRHLQHLEAQLGVRLINRTTRHLSLTEAGERYHAACLDILQRLDQAALAVADDGSEPSGTLRISVPLVIGTLELGNWLPGFQQRYPKIRVDLSCEDRFVDLVAERFDLALRISGPLEDSSLVAKKLTVSDLILVAAPGYVSRQGLPRQVDELATHQLLGFTGSNEWRLNSARADTVVVALNGRFKTDTITSSTAPRWPVWALPRSHGRRCNRTCKAASWYRFFPTTTQASVITLPSIRTPAFWPPKCVFLSSSWLSITRRSDLSC